MWPCNGCATGCATLDPVRQCHCRFASSAPRHHAELLLAGSNVDTAVALIELAVTWEELDYTDQPVIPPHHWLEFWSDHAWPDADLACRLFSAAVDVARRNRGRAPSDKVKV